MKNLNKLLTVIIRSVGERTEELNYELTKQQINERNIFIVGEIPFVKTLEKTYKLALKENRKWTLCIDGDVLLQPESIQPLIEFAEKQTENIFLIQILSIDKFLTFPREVGIRLYRTKVLKNTFHFLEDAKEKIRPESYTVQQIVNMGYEVNHSNILMGIHDFKQYYKDIYRKCFIHSIKHLGYFNMKKIGKLWKKYSKKDNDFKVAFQAYKMAKKYKQKIYIDKEAPFMKNYPSIIKKLQLSEKVKINIDKKDPLKTYNKILFDFSEKDIILNKLNDFTLERTKKLLFKKMRRWLIQIKIQKNKKIIRIFGIYLIKE